MMRTRNRLLFFIIILCFSILFSSNLFAEETWTIAATKFTYAKGQKQNAITDATALMFPPRILENISSSLSRTIPQNEVLERYRYKSKNDRASLFLQMSGLIQKRDVLVLGNYTDKELQEKIAEQEKAIQDLRDKIDENLNQLKEQEDKYEESLKEKASSEGITKYIDLLRNLFVSEQSIEVNEKINLYRNDVNAFFQPSEQALEEDLNSEIYEKEVMGAGIDGIITGTITSYGDFISLTVEAYSFPGANKIGSVTEIGNLADADYISKSIARQLIPLITNSMSINVTFNIEPENLRQKTSLYVDEQFFNEIPSNLVLESGVHRLEFMANGYRHISTSYYFEGNHTYDIKARMEEELEGKLNLNLKTPVEGEIFANGILQRNISVFEAEDGKLHSDSASISVNGKTILGEFIAKDGTSAFYYISEDMIRNHSDFSLNIKTFDRSEYIEKRRKIMYGSYSALVVSLIPSMYVNGQYKTYAAYLDKNSNASDSINQKLQTYKITKNIFTGVALSCGAWFAYEFIRYLMAANTVLPESVKKDNNFIIYENPNPKKKMDSEIINDLETKIEYENQITDEDVAVTENAE